MSELLEEERPEAGVALLRLARPEKRNALSRALRDALCRVLGALEADEGARVVVLTGRGPAFCAGFDTAELAGDPSAFADSADYHRRLHEFPKPLVACVNGPALGGGCDLAALCDVRLASTQAAFGQPQVRFGAPALYALLRECVGAAAARELCLTGRRVDAEEALRLGLVARVVAPDALVEEGLALARGIAALPGDAPLRIKRSFLDAQPRLFGSG